MSDVPEIIGIHTLYVAKVGPTSKPRLRSMHRGCASRTTMRSTSWLQRRTDSSHFCRAPLQDLDRTCTKLVTAMRERFDLAGPRTHPCPSERAAGHLPRRPGCRRRGRCQRAAASPPPSRRSSPRPRTNNNTDLAPGGRYSSWNRIGWWCGGCTCPSSRDPGIYHTGVPARDLGWAEAESAQVGRGPESRGTVRSPSSRLTLEPAMARGRLVKVTSGSKRSAASRWRRGRRVDAGGRVLRRTVEARDPKLGNRIPARWTGHTARGPSCCRPAR